MDSDSTQEKVERLQATILKQEQEVAKLKAELAELNKELAPFEQRYNKATGKIRARIEAAQAAIHDLEDLRHKQFWEDSKDTLDDLWRRNQRQNQAMSSDGEADPLAEMPITPRRLITDENIKQLYRRLARQYHPDLAKDEAERDHRTQIMAMINEAYRDHDIDALHALENTKPTDESAVPDHQLPLAVLKLRQLEQTSADLAVQIQDLKAEHYELMHSTLMDLKLREKLAKMQGRNLLEEVVKDLHTEYQSLMDYLSKLRHSLNAE